MPRAISSRLGVALILLGALMACSTVWHGRTPSGVETTPTPSPSAPTPAPNRSVSRAGDLARVASPRADAPSTIRVALMTTASSAKLSAPTGWVLYAADNATPVLSIKAKESVRIEHSGTDVRAVPSSGAATAWQHHAMIARVQGGSEIFEVNGKHYRGELQLIGTNYGLEVVESTSVEEYLRGVVPLEIGDRTPGDSAAIQAQAVSARSYAYTHLASMTTQDYDVTDNVSDQAYGGVDAETTVGNAAVAATAGVVLMFGGRVVNAPYHSTCGGETAGAEEVWNGPSVPYLKPVSDRIPGTDHYYCEVSPRFTWSRTLTVDQLNDAVAHYLQLYVKVPSGNAGPVRDISIAAHTPTGRVASLDIRTTKGTFRLQGDDIRFVLRKYGGPILESTLFSFSTQVDGDGNLTRVIITGRGFGHGVGMCQYGAIGRARAGQDFRTILRTYYPGTSLGVVQ